jgi:hypothetical protein
VKAWRIFLEHSKCIYTLSLRQRVAQRCLWSAPAERSGDDALVDFLLRTELGNGQDVNNATNNKKRKSI